MISLLAIVLGGDVRAIRMARKLAAVVDKLGGFELRRLLRVIEEHVDDHASEIGKAA